MSVAATEHVASVAEQVERANRSGRKPAVLIHGLWLLPNSWERWAALFEQAGFSAVMAAWPDDPQTVAAARSHPEVFARKSIGQIADYIAGAVRKLDDRPAMVGHSFGGLLAQILAGRGLSAATVAIDPAPFRGVLPLPFSALKSASPVLLNPANRGRAVSLTYESFHYGWTNAISDGEGRRLFAEYHVPGAGMPIFQAAMANVNPWTEVKVDTKNPDRGPLLIIEGDADHTVPWAMAEAAYRRQKRNPGVTEMQRMPNRGHSLVIDGGWREVADAALAFLKRFL